MKSGKYATWTLGKSIIVALLYTISSMALVYMSLFGMLPAFLNVNPWSDIWVFALPGAIAQFIMLTRYEKFSTKQAVITTLLCAAAFGAFYILAIFGILIASAMNSKQ